MDAALDLVPAAVVVTDADGVVTFWSAAAGRLYGYSAEQAIGRRLRRVILPLGQQPGLREALDDSRAERTDPGEWLTQSRDGRQFRVTATSSPLPDTHGRPAYTLTILTEAEERGAAPQPTPSSADLGDASSDAILTVDVDGVITSVSESAEELFGWVRGDLVGRHLAVLTPEAERPEQERVIADVLAGLPVSPVPTRRLRRDGTLLEVSLSLSGLRDERGDVVGLGAVFRDLTRRSRTTRDVNLREALFSALSRRSSDVAVLTDAELTILYTSTSAADVFGYEPVETVGLSSWSFVHPDDHGALRDALDRVMADPARIERLTIRIRHKHGQWRWVEDRIANFLSDLGIGGIVSNLRDMTDQVQAEAQLRRSEASYRAIAETAQAGICVLSPVGKTLYANPKLADILGLSLAQTYSTPVGGLFEAETAPDLEAYVRDRVEQGPTTHEASYRHPDGSELILFVSAVPLALSDAGQVGLLAMVSDVTAERRAEQELRRRALHDVLTDLPNRALLSDRMHMALARQERAEGGSVALIFLDLDQFKAVNDSLGHDAGDLLLVEIGARLRHVVRGGDTVARLGGDEFAVLCENIDEDDAVLLAKRLRRAVEEPIDLHGHRIFVDTSIGVAFSPPQDPSTLLRSADAAMYRAKSDGRGRIRVFDSSLASSADRRLMVMSRLREALSSGAGLDLHYQPIVDLATGTVRGVEALLRWDDERLGQVSPVEVVDTAEATGLTFALDKWVLRRACADLSSRRASGIPSDIQLSVNLSAQNLGATPFDELVRQVAESSGWPTSQLTLEVTESALMTDPESAARLLGALRSQGVSVAVDDFGTGYSSLAYLKRLPVSVLKIDRSFVDSVTTDSDSLAIATSIVDLARGLGLLTVAEGIETPEQAAVMRDLGCTGGQGFLWSPAIPLDGLAEWTP